jgi:peptidyl-prolyl cis-trans isomerase B (cyclophilin B)
VLKKLIALFLLLMIFVSCKDKEMIEENAKMKETIKELKYRLEMYKSANKKFDFLADQMKGIKAKIITNYGDIELEFYPEKAPLHCFNFITRAESGFYDNTQFHRVIKGFMIQAGDPLTKTNDKSRYGAGGPIVNIPNEFNDIKHTPGILSMARTSDVNAGAGSQFFIMHAPYPSLDGQYTAFGKVTKGMDVVNEIAEVKVTKPANLPEKPVRIKTIEVYR